MSKHLIQFRVIGTAFNQTRFLLSDRQAEIKRLQAQQIGYEWAALGAIYAHHDQTRIHIRRRNARAAHLPEEISGPLEQIERETRRSARGGERDSSVTS